MPLKTTLATRSYVSLIKGAKSKGYKIILLYFWLDSPKFAIQRVATRVSKGGHNIPKDIIERRYSRGLKNFLTLYKDICDRWMVIDNMDSKPNLIAESNDGSFSIVNKQVWIYIIGQF